MNKRNAWNLRLQWEAIAHKSTLFIGLTYEDAHIPMTDDYLPTLWPEDVKYWLRMIRRKSPTPLRYYALGEYGTDTGRPHYHVHLFGDYPLPERHCVYGEEQDGIHCMHHCPVDCFVKVIRYYWPHGHATVYPCTPADLAYTTLHHVIGKEPPFKGQHPVWTSMSKQPGIGSAYFDNKNAVDHIFQNGVISHTYTPTGQVTPLPRYYRDKIFTEAEREYLNPEIDESPESKAKSEKFAYEYKKKRYLAKGKL